MRYVLAAIVLLMLLPMAPSNAETWGDNKPTPAPIVVPVTVTVIPADPTLTAAAKDVSARPGLSFKQRRSMGITFRTVRLKLKELHASGELAGKDQGTVAMDVMDSLIAENPKAFADPSLDWDVVLEWIIRIVKILLMFL